MLAAGSVEGEHGSVSHHSPSRSTGNGSAGKWAVQPLTGAWLSLPSPRQLSALLCLAPLDNKLGASCCLHLALKTAGLRCTKPRHPQQGAG